MNISIIKRGQMLDFAGEDFFVPEEINPDRVFKLNDKKIIQGDVIYLIERENRVADNWGLLFAFEQSKELNKNLRVVFGLKNKNFSPKQSDFMMQGLKNVELDLKANNIPFEIFKEDVLPYLITNAGMVVSDFNPIESKNYLAKNLDCAFFEVDSHNIIPVRISSAKQEFSAATFRPKVYRNIGEFLTEYPKVFINSKSEAQEVLEDFIEKKLEYYAELRNDPNKNVVSGLSKYLHFGQISSQRVALEVLKSKASRVNKEAFLEELIVRKELSDNFCFCNPNFDNFDGIHNWAKQNFLLHREDFRQYIYDLETFESAQTHEELWNACQRQLLTEGKIHGYLRMYWAKKILEWSASPEEAIKIAIYLNDTYAIDGIDPNGYIGILWSIGGVHDRAFSEREIFGKIRYMNENGCRKKFDVDAYIKKFKS
ncbi:MAG: deoxyribodipyrimidine photo-lyase [bacterium]